MSNTDFYIKSLSATLLLFVIGFGIRTYLKKSGIDSPKILGIGVFWLKFFANFLLVMGTILLITIGMVIYYSFAV